MKRRLPDRAVPTAKSCENSKVHTSAYILQRFDPSGNSDKNSSS